MLLLVALGEAAAGDAEPSQVFPQWAWPQPRQLAQPRPPGNPVFTLSRLTFVQLGSAHLLYERVPRSGNGCPSPLLPGVGGTSLQEKPFSTHCGPWWFWDGAGQ